MRCPFLKEVTVRFCQVSPLRIMVPSDVDEAGQRCSHPGYENCPVGKGRFWGKKDLSCCPFLEESSFQCCKATSVMKLIPRNDSLFSRCNTNAHRHCQTYLQRAYPRRAKTPNGCRNRAGQDGPCDLIDGIPVPNKLIYSRNHMWLDLGEDGSCDVGVDALLTRVLGEVESVSFVSGKGLEKPVVALVVRGVDLSLTFPSRINVTGSNALLRTSPETLVQDPYGAGWLFEGTHPDWGSRSPGADPHSDLLTGEEAVSWMREETDRVSRFVHETHCRRHPGFEGLMMDGGILSGDLARHLTREELHQLFKRFFTQHGE
jgi:glycine cleavage system H lipoate-binding protein